MEVYIPTNVNTEVQVPLDGSIHSHNVNTEALATQDRREKKPIHPQKLSRDGFIPQGGGELFEVSAAVLEISAKRVLIPTRVKCVNSHICLRLAQKSFQGPQDASIQLESSV